MKTRTLLILAAVRLLKLAGVAPYFDLRRISSSKDVMGSRIRKLTEREAMMTGHIDVPVSPGDRLVLRLYADLSERTAKALPGRVVTGYIAPIPASKIRLEPEHTCNSDGPMVPGPDGTYAKTCTVCHTTQEAPNAQ